MYLVAAYGAGWIDYNHYDWCAIDGPQFCKKHTRDCMSSCYTNLSHMHPKIDCKEVCKFTRPYYSEQKAAQKAVEEKPVERSLNVGEKTKTCKTHCFLYLKLESASGDVDYDWSSWCNDDGPQFCLKNRRDCMSSCQSNLHDMHASAAKIDCNEVCKYTRAYSSALIV